ncbi:MAG: carbamate kinase [Streptosporangiaceae bacterium]
MTTTMTRTAVVALGGNALTKAGEAGSYEEKVRNAASMGTAVKGVLDSGWRVVIVHGNGPQVGNLAIQQEATDLVPAQPLDLLGAMTQGELGSLIARAVDALCGRGTVVPVVTHTVVDAEDQAFRDPTKPIGRFFTREEADRVAADRGWTMREDAHRGYRRVVPSPEPVDMLELSGVRALIGANKMVVAAGGGGIPLVATADGFRGVDAVIDKDNAACLLAIALPAQALLFVTAVETVFVDYGTPRQRPLRRVSSDEAQRYLDDGQFPAGSMGPKVNAALRFLREGGEVVVITTPELLAATLVDPTPRTGTRIERAAAPAEPVR